MRRSRSSREQLCFCPQYRAAEASLHALLVQKLPQQLHPPNVATLSLPALLNRYLVYSDSARDLVGAAEQQLREHLRTDPTLKYTQQDSLLTMIDSLVSKHRKEREVHWQAREAESKALAAMLERQEQLKGQMQYLKQLLAQEQGQLQSWKAEAQTAQQELSSLQAQHHQLQAECASLRNVNNQHNEEVLALNNRIDVLISDKELFSRKCVELSHQLARLRDEFGHAQQAMRYRAKVELLDHLTTHTPRTTKISELTQRIQGASLKGKVGETTGRRNRSLSSGRREDNLYALLNSTAQTINPELQTCGKPHHGFEQLLVGDVLEGQEALRYYLVATLQTFLNNPIARTRLLYTYSPQNPTSIHRLVDHHPHLLFLITTARGHRLAAYSQSGFRPRVLSNQLGLLMALPSRQVFRNTKKSVVYDQEEIVFGNGQLKIRDGLIQSTFGLNGGYYQHHGASVGVLLGEGKQRQARVKHIEAFQLIFDL